MSWWWYTLRPCPNCAQIFVHRGFIFAYSPLKNAILFVKSFPECWSVSSHCPNNYRLQHFISWGCFILYITLLKNPWFLSAVQIFNWTSDALFESISLRSPEETVTKGKVCEVFHLSHIQKTNPKMLVSANCFCALYSSLPAYWIFINGLSKGCLIITHNPFNTGKMRRAFDMSPAFGHLSLSQVTERKLVVVLDEFCKPCAMRDSLINSRLKNWDMLLTHTDKESVYVGWQNRIWI